MRHLGPIAVLLLTSCGESTYEYAGHDTSKYLAFDGDRSWTYVQDDLSIPWQLSVEEGGTSSVNNTDVITLDYSVRDPKELLFSISWSSDASDGILIHGYSVEPAEEGDSLVSETFDTPLVVAEYRMVPGDTIPTTAGGVDYISTLVGVEDCPNNWVPDWECLHFNISDGTDDASSAPFVGDWWFAADWGPSRFQISGFEEDWVLSEATWDISGE